MSPKVVEKQDDTRARPCTIRKGFCWGWFSGREHLKCHERRCPTGEHEHGDSSLCIFGHERIV